MAAFRLACLIVYPPMFALSVLLSVLFATGPVSAVAIGLLVGLLGSAVLQAVSAELRARMDGAS
jgi:hypothetical protein